MSNDMTSLRNSKVMEESGGGSLLEDQSLHPSIVPASSHFTPIASCVVVGVEDTHGSSLKAWKVQHFGESATVQDPQKVERPKRTRQPPQKLQMDEAKETPNTHRPRRKSKEPMSTEGSKGQPKRSRRRSNDPLAPDNKNEELGKRSKRARKQQETNDTTLSEENKDGDAVLAEAVSRAAASETSARFDLPEDPNEYYIEEEAHLYHNPPFPSCSSGGVAPQDLKPIPPPPPFKQLPNTGKCKWTFDELHRILVADFSPSDSADGNFAMDPTDEAFFLEMLERDDITVVSEGLVSTSSLHPEFWNLAYFQRVLKEEYYHKFRRFDTFKDDDGFENCVEVDGMYSMKIGNYIQYLEKRQDVVMGKEKEDPSFSFSDHEGREQNIHVGISALYMIDLDISRLLPNLYNNFLEGFRYPEVLPGGTHCMMNSVMPSARPFMGPNMYVTPPASFTHFHQDGHGTVDSGHLCLSGYNEVVILRRLTERHKKHALMILTGDLDVEENKPNVHDPPTYFDGLYEEPHADQLGKKPGWPRKESIEKCRQMGYCPTLCIVRPGQLIHINKGRLHAFRKMSTSALRDEDCHKELREKVIEEHCLSGEELCISIAWDWMYRGISAAGINREICTILEASVLNRKMRRVSLGIPEFSLFQMAKMFPPAQTSTKLNGIVRFGKSMQQASKLSDSSEAITVCRGILPSLRHVLKQQVSAMELAARGASQSSERGKRVTIAKRPNTHENTDVFPLDPYGSDGFTCKLCAKELSNIYYHCDGCEKILSKDFNICQQCHKEKLFMITVQMHPNNPKRHSTLNHTGNFTYDRCSRCPCKNGPVCKFCNYCSGCSCRCHSWFTLHSRLFGSGEGGELLNRVETAVSSANCEPNKTLDDPQYLENRLEVALRLFH